MDHAHRGEGALSASNFSEAVTHFTEALKTVPTSPNYYIKRSTAYQRLGKHQEALDDAELGVVYATKRAKKELIGQAQLRRGIALFNLERYGDAGFCFELAKKADEKEKSLGIWQKKVDAKLQGLAEDDSKKAVTVTQQPDVKEQEAAAGSSKASNGTAGTHGQPQGATATPNQPTQTPADKIRHEWYQNNENVYLTLLAKGVPKDKTSIDIQSSSLSISFPLVSGANYDFSLDPLFRTVDPAASTSRILSTKIEVILKKQAPGQKWSALEGKHADPAVSNTTTTAASSSDTVAAPTAKGPAYPTSSRSGPKNWDKIAASYVKPTETSSVDTKDKPADDKSDDYINDLDEESDEVNAFFKQLYSGADPDTRRAMMKSYQESGGTALSTNWSEVKDKKYEIDPPDGMEAKKWGE